MNHYLEDENGNSFAVKPCPFCGKEGTAEVTTAQNLEDCKNFEDKEKCPCYEDNFYELNEQLCPFKTVVCNFYKGGCGATCGYHSTMLKAINAWNTRVVI